MGELKSSRATDATFISSTDDNVRNLESDLSEIIGVETDLQILTPIFTAPSSSDVAVHDAVDGVVSSDGSIAGILRFLSTSSSGTAAAGVEFQSTDGSRFKLCATTEHLELFEWNDTTSTWDSLYELDQGVGSFLTLTDVNETEYTGHDNYFVKVSGQGLVFDLPSVGTLAKLEDITDVPLYAGNGDKFLALNPGATAPVWVAGGGGGGGVVNFVDLGDVSSTVVVASQDVGKKLSIQNVGTYSSPSYNIAEEPPYHGKLDIQGFHNINQVVTTAASLENNIPDGQNYHIYTTRITTPAGYGGDLNDEIFYRSGTESVSPYFYIPGLALGTWQIDVSLRIQTQFGCGFYVWLQGIQSWNENSLMGPKYHTFPVPMEWQPGTPGNPDHWGAMQPGTAQGSDYIEKHMSWTYINNGQNSVGRKFTINLSCSSNAVTKRLNFSQDPLGHVAIHKVN